MGGPINQRRHFLNNLQMKIAGEIRKLHVYETERKAYMHIRRTDPQAYPYDRLAELNTRVTMIESWISMLPESEGFAIRRHLADRLDWVQVVHEYKEKWGEVNARSERTLVRYQTRALKRIERFVNDHADWYAGLLDVIGS